MVQRYDDMIISYKFISRHIHLGGEMVDARDLKSLGPQGLYEFESRSRYKILKKNKLDDSLCCKCPRRRGYH